MKSAHFFLVLANIYLVVNVGEGVALALGVFYLFLAIVALFFPDK